jgi:6-phosphogluconate dehydrogenase
MEGYRARAKGLWYQRLSRQAGPCQTWERQQALYAPCYKGCFMEPTADIALIGLAVMGQNLILNMADHGYTVVAFNRTVSKVDEFMNEAAKGHPRVLPAHSIEEMIGMLKRPRKIMLMVKAGPPVDEFIEHLLPHLEPGDLIIDGGNSHFPDTIRRTKELESKGMLYVGTGVSGGEEGARNGPSMMPGGSPKAWPLVKDIFQAICARTPDGEPCCDWMGEDGAGHYVKMVHNGIEYGDMQLICEAYQLLKQRMGMSNEEMHEVFAEWNKGQLDSYLIEITRDILAYKDEKGEYVVDKILDTAGQKGTGKWTSVSSLDLGMPVTLIGEAVYARCLSAMKEARVEASRILSGPKADFSGDKKKFVEEIRKALLASKIISYAQGFMLLREAAKEYKWNLNYGGIAMVWRAGCIIRSVFLGEIKAAFDRNPGLGNLLLDDYFKKLIDESQDSWRHVVSEAVLSGVPVPAFTTALAFYDGYRSERLPANLLQAQRDYFGAHTYERIDQPRGKFFHTNWTGKGGNVSAGTYTV